MRDAFNIAKIIFRMIEMNCAHVLKIVLKIPVGPLIFVRKFTCLDFTSLADGRSNLPSALARKVEMLSR